MNNHDLNTLILCSFRYALGRRSYIVQEISDLIVRYIDEIQPWVKEKIIKEVEDSFRRKELGMKCDIETWCGLIQKIRMSIAFNLQKFHEEFDEY